MNSPKLYVKDNQTIYTSTRFIYNSSVYRISKRGAYLIDDTYYSSEKPLDSKRMTNVIRKSGYIVQRFLTLEGAPEEYLINNGYKIKNV